MKNRPLIISARAEWMRRAQWVAWFSLIVASVSMSCSFSARGAEATGAAIEAMRDASGVLTKTEWGAIVLFLIGLNGVLLWLRERDRKYNRIEITRVMEQQREDMNRINKEHRGDLQRINEEHREDMRRIIDECKKAINEFTSASQALRDSLRR